MLSATFQKVKCTFTYVELFLYVNFIILNAILTIDKQIFIIEL